MYMYWFWRARLHCINIKANWVKPTCSRHIQYIYYKIIIYNTLYYYVIYSNCISSNIRNAAFTVLKWIHVNTCTYLQTEYTCRYPFETFERDSSEIQASQISETWAKIEHGNNERDTAVRKRDNLNKNWAGHLARRDIFMACLWPDYRLIFYGCKIWWFQIAFSPEKETCDNYHDDGRTPPGTH